MFARDSDVAYSVRGAFQPTSSKRGYRQSRRTSPAPAALDSAQELFQTVKGNTEEEACDGAQGLLRTVMEPRADVEHADGMMRERYARSLPRDSSGIVRTGKCCVPQSELHP